MQDCTIDTDLEILIPDEYVESITERLSLYTRLDNSETEQELQQMKETVWSVPPGQEYSFTLRSGDRSWLRENAAEEWLKGHTYQ